MSAVVVAVVVVFGHTVTAANLVPNPSFETYTTCPISLSQTNLAVPWIAPTTGSSDYYNACATTASNVNVPNAMFGPQTAHTGVAYAGMIVRPVFLYREYVEVALTSPLTAGQPVNVEFWVSLSDNSRDAIDRIGAYLSVGSVGPPSNSLPLPFTPQIESLAGTFLNDKNNWMQVSGTFTPAGGEDHIVIGNFHDNANTSVQQLSGWYPGSYYYVDDVSVEPLVPPMQGTDTYAAKFLCGVQQDGEVTHVVDAQAGRYASKINVHNNTGLLINFRKKVIRLRGGEMPIPPAPTKPLEKLAEDEAMEVVCRDVYTLLNIPIVTGQIPPFVEGFVILEVYHHPGTPTTPPDPLDVEGVYTYKGDLQAPPAPGGSDISVKVVVYPAKANGHVLH